MDSKTLFYDCSPESKTTGDKFKITTSCGVKQLGNKQDFSITGINL